MNRIISVFLLLNLMSCFSSKKETKSLKLSEKDSEMQKIAYGLGSQFAKAMKILNLEQKEQEYLVLGLKEALADKSQMSPADAQSYAKKVDKIIQEKRKENAVKYKAEGKIIVDKFLADNPDYEKSSSGLVFKVIKAGSKLKRVADDSFFGVHYNSHRLDDTQYETTEPGNPRILPFKGVFKAWQEAFLIAGPGGEIEIIAPSDLTYGDNGAEPYIKPGEYLKFKMKFYKYYSKKP